MMTGPVAVVAGCFVNLENLGLSPGKNHSLIEIIHGSVDVNSYNALD